MLAETLTLISSTETLATARQPSPTSKAMWRAIASNSKHHSFPFRLRCCRSTSSVALSAAASSTLSPPDAAAVARLSQGAASWFCIHLFSNNGEGQYPEHVSSYQESVSTIDSVLCSLPLLTNHMKLSPSSSSCNRGAWFQDKFCFSKPFGSASHAVATLEGASDTLEEQNIAAETFTLSPTSLVSETPRKLRTLPSLKEPIAKISAQPETLDSSEFIAFERWEESFPGELQPTLQEPPTLEMLDAQSVTLRGSVSEEMPSLECVAVENLLKVHEEDSNAPISSTVTDAEAFEATQSVSKRVPAAKEAALALCRYRQRMREKQRKMEMEAYWKATLEYKNMVVRMCKKKLAPNVPFVRSLLLSWFEPYRDALRAEQTAIIEKEYSVDRTVYGPHLLELPADILAVVVMHKLMAILMREQEQGYVRLLNAAVAIGEAVEQETEIYRIMNKRKKWKWRDTSLDAKDVALRMRVEKMIKQQNVRLLDKTLKKERASKPWGSELQIKVGSRLIDILMNVAFIHPPASQSLAQDPPEVRPALKHELKTFVGKKKGSARLVGVLVFDPAVWTSLEKSARFIEMPYMPMVVEPVKWTSYKKGGYIVLRSRLMRTHGAQALQFELTRTPKAQLRGVFNALDILGRTPWRINTRVLDVVEKLWADGGRLANLVDRDNVELPKRPDTKDELEVKAWRKEFFRRKRINSERHSQRCDIELKLSVARKYKKESKFYYPHNLDFRGRAYPMHPYLNHLGSDLCRGLLEFGEGRPLGRSGLRWLKIHLANVFATGGVDKLSFDGRVAFIDENMERIKDSAMQPLEGKRWWLKAEDPFQCLAACMSLRDALESNDVENFICYTPVQQDGSCNGLQHYAALGRDIGGAKSVNLVAGERPSDVYSGIANRVRQIMERDAAEDNSDSHVEHARALVGQVDRKLVKQTVMTSVYGVTFIGARAQILNRLEERNKDSDNSHLFSVSAYAAKATLGALGEMFKEAKGIMNWLSECAKLVACQNQAVKWCSPMGLPVVQPYRRPGWKQVRTSLQIFKIRNDNDQPVFVQRQKTAFPPNFVHSLDSTHMMMTALGCAEAGLLFAGVHDSFWTHACDVDKMNQILREKFIELYSQPILENLLKSFEKSFPDVCFPPLPERGGFDLEEVLESPYFFN